MTDTTEASTAAAEPSSEAWSALADATAAAIDSEQQSDDDQDDGHTASRREARYRVQLREAEAERDQLRANVEALQRAEVERIAGTQIQKPGALWSAEVQLADMLDDAGTVDPAKVKSAVSSARETLGLATTKPGSYVGSEGQPIGNARSGDPWQNAFKA